MNKNKYETQAHAKTRLRYHIVFSTKYRKKVLNQIRQDVYDAFRYVESKSRIKILTMEIDENHIHLLVKWPPCYSIEQTVRRLKQLSTWYLWDKQKAYLKKQYWKRKIIWSRGYFISTIGDTSEKTVKKYIEHQG